MEIAKYFFSTSAFLQHVGGNAGNGSAQISINLDTTNKTITKHRYQWIKTTKLGWIGKIKEVIGKIRTAKLRG